MKLHISDHSRSNAHTLVLVALFFVLCVLCASIDATVYKPEYDAERVLFNPLTGFAQYLSRQAGESELDKTMDVPDVGTVKISDYATTYYIRPSWRGFNPAENVYAWRDPTTTIGKLIANIKSRGKFIAFRFVIDGRDQGENTPTWVINKGIAHWVSDVNNPTRTTPFPQDEIFKEYYSKFITEFAKDFNDPSFVSFIDAYSMGKWGEAHDVRYSLPDDTTITDDIRRQLKRESVDWFVTLHSEQLSKIPLFINYHRVVGETSSWGSVSPDSQGILDNAIAKGYSLRHDAFGMTGYYQKWEKDYVASKNYQVPIVLEGGWVTPDMRYWIDPSGDYREGHPEDVRVGEVAAAEVAKVNMMDFRRQEVDTWFGAGWSSLQKFNQQGGYRVYPTEVDVPDTCYIDDEITIKHTWMNKGWGYLPNNIKQWNYKYKPAIVLLDDDNNVIQLYIDSTSEPSEWYQNEPNEYTYTIKINNDDVSVGTYTWGIGIVDQTVNNKPGIQLSVNTDSITTNGWVILGDVKIEEKKNDDDDSQEEGGEEENTGSSGGNSAINTSMYTISLIMLVATAIIINM